MAAVHANGTPSPPPLHSIYTPPEGVWLKEHTLETNIQKLLTTHRLMHYTYTKTYIKHTHHTSVLA